MKVYLHIITRQCLLIIKNTPPREGSGNIINPALMRVSKMGKLILINVWDEVRDY